MPSIPLTPTEEKQILNALNIQSIDDLFSSVPPQIRKSADFKIEPEEGLSEHDLRVYFQNLSQKNATFPNYSHFLGGGIYDNVIPALVNQLVLRGEFLTCYTPYQPEISQGTLQAIFEFQTMIARMTGMPVANASMYDGATATTEAILMAQRLGKNKPNVLIASTLHPEYKNIATTFLKNYSPAPIEIKATSEGTLDLDHLQQLIKEHNPSSVVVGMPNYLGILEPLAEIRALCKDTHLITAIADPTYLSVYEPPGSFGADIVVGEAHQLGTPMLFGGPHVGFFATKKEYLRQMPGRLCGETLDADGKIAYTLTLSTREQHIRREKATSNICTNQGLIALRTVIYLSFLGKEGFQNLGKMNYSLFKFLTEKLEENGIPLKHKAPHYREGVFEVPHLEKRYKKALAQKIIPGIKLAENNLLICAHPKQTKKDIERLVEVLSHD
jgi:glycine dehydrogenase subunit 1